MVTIQYKRSRDGFSAFSWWSFFRLAEKFGRGAHMTGDRSKKVTVEGGKLDRTSFGAHTMATAVLQRLFSLIFSCDLSDLASILTH